MSGGDGCRGRMGVREGALFRGPAWGNEGGHGGKREPGLIRYPLGKIQQKGVEKKSTHEFGGGQNESVPRHKPRRGHLRSEARTAGNVRPHVISKRNKGRQVISGQEDSIMATQLEIAPCGHCGGSGTCRNASNKMSCAGCARHGLFQKYAPADGLVCSICGGTGFIEPVALRLKHRTGPVLAAFIMSAAILTILVGHEKHFTEVLAFLGTLTGAITGFYFGGNRSSE